MDLSAFRTAASRISAARKGEQAAEAIRQMSQLRFPMVGLDPKVRGTSNVSYDTWTLPSTMLSWVLVQLSAVLGSLPVSSASGSFTSSVV